MAMSIFVLVCLFLGILDMFSFLRNMITVVYKCICRDMHQRMHVILFTDASKHRV